VIPTRPGRARWLGIYLRGIAMGVAELVPGVSGGTVAFITGIYLDLVRSIRGAGEALLRHLPRGAVALAWERSNGGFLLVLGAGMATGILALARIVSWLLENRELQLQGFFFGLILASVLFVGRFARPFTAGRRGVLALGVAAGAAAAFATTLSVPVNPVTLFLGGMVAICAWILPGVSGSFVLLLLGLYPAVVAAIATLDLKVLGVLAAGCGLGLLLFARVLGWLLDRYYRGTLALLCGFMAGSLVSLWPWRLPRAVVEGKAVGVRFLLPGDYAAGGGGDPVVVSVLLTSILGLGVVAALEYMTRIRGGDTSMDASGEGEVPQGARG
jgi:putative membrane protein